jgi:hypothetical protein
MADPPRKQGKRRRKKYDLPSGGSAVGLEMNGGARVDYEINICRYEPEKYIL